MSHSNPNHEPYPLVLRYTITAGASSFLALVVAAACGAPIPWEAFLIGAWLTGKAMSIVNGDRGDDPPPWQRVLAKITQVWPVLKKSDTASNGGDETEDPGARGG